MEPEDPCSDPAPNGGQTPSLPEVSPRRSGTGAGDQAPGQGKKGKDKIPGYAKGGKGKTSEVKVQSGQNKMPGGSG